MSATGRYQNLVFTVTATKRVYAQGEFVPLTFTVQNTGTTDASSVISYIPVDGEIADQGGRVLRPLFDPGPFTLGVVHNPFPLVYQAGQTRTFSINWNQHKTVGGSPEAVAPGIYRFRAFIAVDNLDGVDVPTHALGTDFLDVTVQ